MPKTREAAALAARSHRGAIAITLTLCSIGVATPVQAEDAAQWRIEDGGNGHWYRLVPWSETPCIPNTDCWHDFKSHAESVGGHLVTFTSAAELDWVYARLVDRPEAWEGTIGPTIGLHQPSNAPNYVEPAGGWQWVDGTPMVFTNWGPGEPNDQLTQCGCENWAYFGGTGTRIPTWFDGGDGGSGTLLIEWDADCNGDGIVDHGQILDGTFLDLDGNGVPDCCDAGTNCDPYLDVPHEYPTIQSAINDCPDGGTIRLAPGDYTESLVFPARAIRVLGDPDRPSTIRVLGCCGANAIAHVQGPFDGWITFEGVTIARGPAYGFTVDRSGLRLLDCIVSNCGDAGVILHTSARGEFRRTTFTRNQGRGMYAYVNSFIDAEDCDFVENRCPCYGGGIGLHVGSGCDVRSSRFVGNWAATGGAIGLSFSGSRVFTDCVFEDNEADGDPLWSTEFGGSATSVNGLFCGHSTQDIGGGFVDGGGNDFRPGGCDLGCPADFSDDEVVGAADLGILLAHYRDHAGFPQGDLNQDGELDAADLGLLLNAWGPCPE